MELVPWPRGHTQGGGRNTRVSQKPSSFSTCSQPLGTYGVCGLKTVLRTYRNMLSTFRAPGLNQTQPTKNKAVLAERLGILTALRGEPQTEA